MKQFTISILILLIFTFLVNANLYAQNFSFDGNRWYEVEVSIFSNQQISSADGEIIIPEKIVLSYPQNIRQLDSPTSSLNFNFNLQTINLASDSEQPVIFGPKYHPAENNFGLIDFGTTAFISLGSNSHKFTDINQRISDSPEHELLYHSVWRQPVLNKNQSTAVFIRGGDRYNNQNELEGSLIISFNVNRIDVDAVLWFNTFATGASQLWTLPPQAFESNEEGLVSEDYVVWDVAYMKEVRSMISNTFHYLDHPAFGMLIQVRPYQLPNNFEQN